MTGTVTLQAVDLLSKWGFHDGDVLEAFWDELEAEGLSPHQDGLLETLVERNLAPLLPPDLKPYRICSGHNPIRIDWEVPFERLASISVDVTAEQVVALARELRSTEG